ncbi:transposase [Candidatus Chlorohelix allophototropha]|uniref:Mutator family transposase n=1 Tax=Candidatus Chlorohelix allophototropha TaxID=3003348 RepID=A0ABY9B8Z1_9CHLR|nr:transposase [Chloroflexota bacterium L227-S17]
MAANNKPANPAKPSNLPSVEVVQQELDKASSIEDFFGREGIFAKLFARTLEQMLEAELTDHLGYEKYEAKGRNSGNSRNGKVTRQLNSSAGSTTIQVPRDRNGEFEPTLLKKYGHNTNELEEKILGLYGKGLSIRDLQETLQDLYGVEISPATISAITDKIWPMVEAWQNRPLARSSIWTPSL